jgi:DNA-binding LacI/PurR family transcriptional regulator
MAKRVWNVIEELGYYPNTQARALVSGRSRIFGLIISDITNPFFPEIVQVFETIAVQNRYEILLSSTSHDPKRMESSVRRMIERRVEGVAVLTFGMEEPLLEHLHVREVPLVWHGSRHFSVRSGRSDSRQTQLLWSRATTPWKVGWQPLQNFWRSRGVRLPLSVRMT